MAKKVIPTARLRAEGRRVRGSANWGAISWYLRIGPATRRGKKATKRPYSRRESPAIRPRRASTRKAICSKV
jgi:hypothetical protein